MNEKELTIDFIRSTKLTAIEFKLGFPWKSGNLNSIISEIYGKFSSLYKKIEIEQFHHSEYRDTSDTNVFVLEFSSKKLLTFQNLTIHKEFTPIIEIPDFLRIPSGRSQAVIFKHKRFYTYICDQLKKGQFREDPIVSIPCDFEGYVFDLIIKKKLGYDVMAGYTILFYLDKIKLTEKDVERLLEEHQGGDSKKPSLAKAAKKVAFSLKSFKKKTSLPSHIASVFGENADFDELKNSIIREYMPDNLDDENELPLQRKVSVQRKRNIKERQFVKSSSYHQLIENSKILMDAFKSTDHDFDILDDWGFDVSKLESIIEKHRVLWLSLTDLNLISLFNLNVEALTFFMEEISEKYNCRKNPFHNYDHGVSVMHASQYLIKRTTNLKPMTQLAVVIAAYCHDVDHTGRTNPFEVGTKSELALTYHDRSVLEQHHAAVTFKILKEGKCNFLQNMSTDDFKNLRKDIVHNILSTDMKEHTEVCKHFHDLTGKVLKDEDNYDWTGDDVRCVTGMLLHCSDLSGATKPFEIASSWSRKVNLEFSAQYEEEIRLGLPPTPYYKDLDKPHVMAKNEVNFISFLVKPLWDYYNQFSKGNCDLQMANINKNIEEWERIRDEATKELEKKK